MPWYAYKLDGWQIAVDAINRSDAAQYIKRAAPGAEFQGEFTPPSMVSGNYSMATAMTTARRQEQISETVRRENELFMARTKVENPDLYKWIKGEV